MIYSRSLIELPFCPSILPLLLCAARSCPCDASDHPRLASLSALMGIRHTHEALFSDQRCMHLRGQHLAQMVESSLL